MTGVRPAANPHNFTRLLVSPETHTGLLSSLTIWSLGVFAKLLVPSIAPCPIGKLLAETDPESATNLRTALALSFRDLSNAKIHRAILEEAKVSTSVETISAHRKGECRCTTP